MSINLNEQLSPHFRLGEFIKRPIKNLPVGVEYNLKVLAGKLEEVRAKLGNRPIIITSGYRDPEYNRSVKGAKKSYHLYGMAADIAVVGLTPKQVQQRLDAWWPGGLGYGETFTHLDIRGKKTRFQY